MSISRFSKALAAGALVLALAGPVAADDDTNSWSPHWGMGGMMGGWGQGPMAGQGPDAMVDRIEGRLAFLKAELKITDAQTGAWDAFAATMRTTSESHVATMRSMMEEMHSGEFSKKTLPERLALRQSHMEARLEEIKSLAAAADALYAVLDDTQKKAADELALPMMGMGMMGMGQRMGMGFGMGRGMGPRMMWQ
jgi:hypothetical protein